jgi:[NiFe] hydrogenase diaphorase moiety large subunit
MDLTDLLARHRHDPTRLVQLFRDVQEAAGWISPATITELAGKLGLPRARVEGVAGFYSFFSTTPQGEYRVLFSDCITDQFLGSRLLRSKLCKTLKVRPGTVREDGRVSVDVTSCTGLCEQGPALLVNGRAIGSLTEARIELIARCIEARQPLGTWPAEFFIVEDVVHRGDVLLSSTVARGQPVRAALARGAEGTLEQVLRSKLRGRGGAGFSTAEKWRTAKEAPGPTRFVVCNADEGEPGTFKDRALLRHHLDLVLDGMTVCALAIGAQRGFIYLRGEYLFLVPALEATLAARHRTHLLGRDVLGRRGFDFDVELHLGAGAYVCGEESALIESLEGKRGIPRNRPPYPVTHGYLQQPTVVNNVETFAAAALIALIIPRAELLRLTGLAPTSRGSRRRNNRAPGCFLLPTTLGGIAHRHHVRSEIRANHGSTAPPQRRALGRAPTPGVLATFRQESAPGCGAPQPLARRCRDRGRRAHRRTGRRVWCPSPTSWLRTALLSTRAQADHRVPP